MHWGRGNMQARLMSTLAIFGFFVLLGGTLLSPAAAAQPAPPPVLTLNGQPISITVPVNSMVTVGPAGAQFGYWNSPDCTGFPDVIGWSPANLPSSNVPRTVGVQARWPEAPEELSACLTITWEIVPTEVPTTAPTLVPTEVPTTVPTLVPTEVPTTVPTLVPTEVPTTVPTLVPTEVPTTVPTLIPTDEPTTTTVPTGTATTTGAAAVILVTSDGEDVPDSALVCVGDVCQPLGVEVSSAAASGSSLTFANLAPGTYPVTVTDASPYADATGSVTVVAGETATVTILLDRAAVPTQPGNATPVTTVTSVPTSKPSGGTAVKTLPNTGAGSETSGTSLMLLFTSFVLVLIAGASAWKRRIR